MGWIFCILVALVLVYVYGVRLLVWLGSLQGLSVVSRLPHITGRKRVVITIDDVPWGSYSSCVNLLKLAKTHKVPLTFLVIGSDLSKAPREQQLAIQEAVAEGYLSLANHGNTNSTHWRLSNDQLENELKECEKAVKSLGLKLTPYYRPGHGYFHEKMISVASRNGYKILLGDVYPHDPQVPLSYLNLINILVSVRDGSIIILHDRPWTASLLSVLFPCLSWLQYEVVGLDKVLL